MNIYTKWLLIVGLNAILGFVLGVKPSDAWFQVGIIAGVATWWLAYVCLDKYLIQIGCLAQSHRLALSALLRAPLQLTLLPEMYAGLAAMKTVEVLGISNLKIAVVDAYFLTIFTGLYLSFVCGLVYLFVSAVVVVRKVRKSA